MIIVILKFLKGLPQRSYEDWKSSRPCVSGKPSVGIPVGLEKRKLLRHASLADNLSTSSGHPRHKLDCK